MTSQHPPFLSESDFRRTGNSSLDPAKLLQDFLEVASLSGVQIPDGTIQIEQLPPPHIPPKRLPANCAAVYVFAHASRTLKVGKVGPKSKARYTSQHYSPGSSRSNLALSLLKEGARLGFEDLSHDNVGDWIKQNTLRVNFIVPASLGSPVWSLLEAFLQCRLRPEFEGFASQR